MALGFVALAAAAGYAVHPLWIGHRRSLAQVARAYGRRFSLRRY